MKSPIFIFSLPRSGSTLLQRVLMSHTSICSVAEPWVLLPFCYALKEKGTLTEYSHSNSNLAINDFISSLPNGKADYYEELSLFISKLYELQCKKDEIYFLDKTPRYYLIISEIMKIFPNAKFIYLFRNPLHVLSSMLSTWSNGRLNKLYAFEHDLILGTELLSKGYKVYSDRAIAVNYEALINDTQATVKNICSYLQLDYQDEMLNSFIAQNVSGNMGDSTGILEYKEIVTSTLDKWKTIINSPIKKKVAIHLIGQLDANALDIQGYNKQEVLKSILTLSGNRNKLFQDSTDLLYSAIVKYSRINLILNKLNKQNYLS